MGEKPVVLKLIDGGKADKSDPIEPKLSGSGPKGPDWLRDIEYGRKFLAYDKRVVDPVVYEMFGVAFKLDEAILLAYETERGAAAKWFNSQNFSNRYKFVALLPEYNPSEEEGNNGNNLP